MIVTVQHRSNGWFTTIDHDGVLLTIHTENGTTQELVAEAHNMLVKARRLIRNAETIYNVVHAQEVQPCRN